MLKIGELFAGYGGLGMGVMELLDAEVAWVSEFDKHPSTILAKRFPNAPNFGDITKIKWTPDCPSCTRETVVRWSGDTGFYWCAHCEAKWTEAIRTADIPAIIHILTGGSPCQDLSHAGIRLGMKAGTRSGLWVNMLHAIKKLRPRLVIWENVGGAFSAEATSEMEPCPGCVGHGDGGAILRALGRVLGDLTAAGYDTEWHSLRAADIGAPHGRLRVFVTAWPRETGKPKLVGRTLISDTHDSRRSEQRGAIPSPPEHATLERNLSLLPTPAVNDMGAAYDPETWDEWTARMKAAHGNGNGHGKSLHIEALRMLPTPSANIATNGGSQHPDKRRAGGHQPSIKDVVEHKLMPTPRATDGTKGGPNQRGSKGDLMLPSAAMSLLPTPEASQSGSTPEQHLARTPGRSKVTALNIVAEHQLLPTPTSERPDGRKSDAFREGRTNFFDVIEQDQWGEYTPAIARWESVLGRPAPDPTLPTGRDGKHQLSAKFVEWLMGLPPGHVTDIDIPRNAQLKALGNGVVPQQAAEALRRTLDPQRVFFNA